MGKTVVTPSAAAELMLEQLLLTVQAVTKHTGMGPDEAIAVLAYTLGTQIAQAPHLVGMGVRQRREMATANMDHAIDACIAANGKIII